jgi:hypothetical protein
LTPLSVSVLVAASERAILAAKSGVGRSWAMAAKLLN